MSKQYSTIPRYSLKLVKERALRYPLDKVNSPYDAESVLRAYLEDQDCEHLIMLILDGNNNLVGVTTIGIGGISGMSVALRDIFKHAIAGRAHAFILGHNHPSGDPTPSLEDIELTKRVKEAGKLLGIPIVDHIVVSSGMSQGVYSFQSHGLVF
jgi:DNA repair protein RadC